jgi:hypothetical protein
MPDESKGVLACVGTALSCKQSKCLHGPCMVSSGAICTFCGHSKA